MSDNDKFYIRCFLGIFVIKKQKIFHEFICNLDAIFQTKIHSVQKK